MSGIFRYNYNTNVQTTTPKKVFSPFSTSPGQLQDVTSDGQSLGFRSFNQALNVSGGSNSNNTNNNSNSGFGCGNTPPGQRLSIREYDKQLTSLRNENFNLKLRIYFLEEKNSGTSTATNSGEGTDNLFKQNIDLKVETEALRRELQEKQELLCQAAKVMELMEESQKGAEEKNQATIEDLTQKVQFLELEIKALEKSALAANSNNQENTNFIDSTTLTAEQKVDDKQRIAELEEYLKEYELKSIEYNKQIQQLEENILERDEQIKECKIKIDQMAYEMAERKEKSNELDNQINNEKNSIDTQTDDVDDWHYKNVLSYNELNVVDQYKEQLKNENVRTNEYTKIIGDQCRLMKYLHNIINLKNQLCECKKDLAEKTCALSEIEGKLEEKSSLADKGCQTIQKLMRKIKSLGIELEQLKNGTNNDNQQQPGQSYHSDTADELKPKENSTYDELLPIITKKDDEIQKLKTELNATLIEAQQAHAWRRECTDLCGLLTNRLQELAEFLDSLLRHQDILGLLAQDRRKAMRKAVDKSLDLSRSLHNLSISNAGGRLSFNENSLMQLSYLCTSYEDSLMVDNDKENLHKVNNNNNNNNNQRLLKCENDKSQLIENLQAEIKCLKVKLENTTSTVTTNPTNNNNNNNNINSNEIKREKKLLTIDPNSESEAWSEPDRNVSTARIGLDTNGNHRSGITLIVPKRISNKFNNNNNNNGGDVNQLTATTTTTTTSSSSSPSPSDINLGGVSQKKLQNKIRELEFLLVESDNALLKSQCQFMTIDTFRKAEELEFKSVTKKLQQLQSEYDELKKREKHLQSRNNTEILNLNVELSKLRQQIEEKCTQEKVLMEKIEGLTVDIRVSDMKLIALQKDYDELKTQHRKQFEMIQNEHQQTVNDMKIEIGNRYEKELNEQSDQINVLKRYENELNSQLIENEKTIRMYKKNLDESVLNASKAVLERTKFLQEKIQLEKDFTELQDQYNRSKIRESELTSKISQLEYLNANLQHSLIVNDSENYNKLAKSISLGNTNRYLTEVIRKSDRLNNTLAGNSVTEQEQGSGCTSSDEMNKRYDNSSPDLGIESDAGRVSSVEGGSAAACGDNANKSSKCTSIKQDEHELLKLDESSMAPVTLASGGTCHASGHDCEKIEKENIELKRKLKRTHRALENTLSQLQKSNQRKEQVEKDILQEIYKTHNVLKNVRSNMENVEQQQQHQNVRNHQPITPNKDFGRNINNNNSNGSGSSSDKPTS